MVLTTEERAAMEEIMDGEPSELDLADYACVARKDWCGLYANYLERIEDKALKSDPAVQVTLAWSVPLLRDLAAGKVPPVIPPRRKRKPTMVMTDWRSQPQIRITGKTLHLPGKVDA